MVNATCAKATVRFVVTREKTSKIWFVTLHSAKDEYLMTIHGISPDYDQSLVLLDDGECLIKSDATLQTSSNLNLSLSYTKFFRFLPKKLQDCYDLVIVKRCWWFGKQAAYFAPTHELKKRFLEDWNVDEISGIGEGYLRI